jgi:hypothetical protein
MAKAEVTIEDQAKPASLPTSEVDFLQFATEVIFILWLTRLFIKHHCKFFFLRVKFEQEHI